MKYTRPTLFRWAVLSTGQFVSCRVFPNRQPSPGNHAFGTVNLDGGYTWGPWFDGEFIEPSGFVLDFNMGSSWVGMERGNANDPGTGEWIALGAHRAGGVYSWGEHSRLPGNHGPGTYQILAADHGKAVN